MGGISKRLEMKKEIKGCPIRRKVSSNVSSANIEENIQCALIRLYSCAVLSSQGSETASKDKIINKL